MRGIGQLFLFAYGDWFFGLYAGAWFWFLFWLLVLASTATKVVDLGSGLGSLLGFFVMFACDVCLCCSVCVVLIVMFACVVLLGVVLLVLCACVVCLCCCARVLLLSFACPKESNKEKDPIIAIAPRQ